MTPSESVTTIDDQALVMERVFDAPRELVWRAWTEPKHFARWYGPDGFTIPTCEIDFRVGGRHFLGMRSPDSFEMWSTGVYREIVPLERFVASMSSADADGNVVPGAEENAPHRHARGAQGRPHQDDPSARGLAGRGDGCARRLRLGSGHGQARRPACHPLNSRDQRVQGRWLVGIATSIADSATGTALAPAVADP